MANGKQSRRGKQPVTAAYAFIDTNIWIRVLSQGRPGCEVEHLEALEKMTRASSLILIVPEVVELEIAKQWRSFHDDIIREIGSLEKAFSDAISKKKLWNEIDDVQKKVTALLSEEKKTKVSDARP